MAKKATGKRTPSRILWEVIDAERARQGVTCEKLSDIAGFSRSTVITDKQDPDKITLYRLWCYLAALGISADEVLRPIAMEHAENMIRREPQ